MDRDNSDKMRFSGAGGAGPGGSGLSVREKGRAGGDPAALWGAGNTKECGAVKPHNIRAAHCQPHATPHALHAGTSPVCPPIVPFLGVMTGFGDSKASQPQPFPWELSKEQPKSSDHPRMGQRTGRCSTPTSQQPHSKAQRHQQDQNLSLPPGSLSVASLDPTASQVASSPPVQPWASPRTSGLAVALSDPQNSKSQDLPQEPPSHSTQVLPA